ncbi:hypothetical protein K3722_12135 [Leisingera caerulea]|uniref:Putative zinc-ribbon domain-containing protein n=1 Tax=Leisingera caerulea TaxID=506591 RepID=A0ABY5WSH0_LEICA|nr:hypothetical protein K3722_12135 [Leisingera caerulea]
MKMETACRSISEMNCPYCDTDLSPTASVCPQCGHDLLSESDEVGRSLSPLSTPPPPVSHSLWLVVGLIGIVMIFFMF